MSEMHLGRVIAEQNALASNQDARCANRMCQFWNGSECTDEPLWVEGDDDTDPGEPCCRYREGAYIPGPDCPDCAAKDAEREGALETVGDLSRTVAQQDAEIKALKVREAEAERMLVAAAGLLYDAYHDGQWRHRSLWPD